MQPRFAADSRRPSTLDSVDDNKMRLIARCHLENDVFRI